MSLDSGYCTTLIRRSSGPIRAPGRVIVIKWVSKVIEIESQWVTGKEREGVGVTGEEEVNGLQSERARWRGCK